MRWFPLSAIIVECIRGNVAFSKGNRYEISRDFIMCDKDFENGHINAYGIFEFNNIWESLKAGNASVLNRRFEAKFKVVDGDFGIDKTLNVMCTCGKSIELTDIQFLDIIYSDSKGCVHNKI